MTAPSRSQPIVELLERADEYLGTISNKGNCGPHHLVSDLAAALRSTDAAATAPDWQDDPSSDERWNAGVDYALEMLCDYLGVEPGDVTWDAATEAVDGDINAVIGNILRTKFGEDWGPNDPAQAATPSKPVLDRDVIAALVLNMWTHGSSHLQIADEILRRLTNAAQGGLATVQIAADEVVSRVCEWDDRTSPDDFPEALLITPTELHRELMRFAEDIGALAVPSTEGK